MIVVESRLAELFAGLPPITVDNVDFPIQFQYGDIADFDLYLKEETQKYPIIWLETGFEELHNDQEKVVDVNLSFKIATSALRSTLLNHQRIATTFGEVLIPTLELVRKTFVRSNITIPQDQEFTLQKFYNYGDDEGTEQSEIIDAIRFDVSLKINGDCLQTVNYGK